MPKNKSAGNALFLILIAVALFAALSYAITQSSRGGGANVSREQMQIKASQLISKMAEWRAAVQRMRAAGIPADKIRFHPDNNPSPPCTETDGTCLFTPEGGGITMPNVSELEGIFESSPSAMMFQTNEAALGLGLPNVRFTGFGTDANDGMVEFIGVKKEFCTAWNRILKIDEIPVLDASAAANMPAYVLFDDMPSSGALCIDAAIMTGTPTPFYVAVYVLIEQ